MNFGILLTFPYRNEALIGGSYNLSPFWRAASLLQWTRFECIQRYVDSSYSITNSDLSIRIHNDTCIFENQFVSAHNK